MNCQYKLNYISCKQEVHRKQKDNPKFHPLNVEYFQRITELLLDKLYPCLCKNCNVKCTKPVGSRPARLRCPECHRQESRLKNTPLQHFRMPLWFFGWAIEESLIRHPKVLTATEIKKRLGISYPSALFLKRRIQVLACEQMPHIKKLFHSTLEQEFKNFKLPKDGTDITNKVKYRPVVHADTMVLYSASQRANKGRKRHKHKGMTSAIYLSDKLGGKQIGTLVHVMGWQNGPVLLTSISDQKANTIGPLIKESIPMNAPVFTDEGYTWLYRIYKNHRMINHSAKGKDERSAFSCERWSKNGVHNQVSEGLNGSLKSAFRGYGYIKPEWSTMYLNEWSFFKNARYFGLNQIAREKQNCTLSLQKISVSGNHQNQYSQHKFEPLTLEMRKTSDISDPFSSPEIRKFLEIAENLGLKDAMVEHQIFLLRENSKPYQRVKERKYNFLAQSLWQHLKINTFASLNEICLELQIENKNFHRIVRRWSSLNLIELRDLRRETQRHGRREYQIYRRLQTDLPEILYMKTKNQYREIRNEAG